MTLVVAWIGVDSRKVSSAYIATDSRITWPGASVNKYDNAKKLYPLKIQQILLVSAVIICIPQ